MAESIVEEILSHRLLHRFLQSLVSTKSRENQRLVILQKLLAPLG
jgi:hypothetical protein